MPNFNVRDNITVIAIFLNINPTTDEKIMLNDTQPSTITINLPAPMMEVVNDSKSWIEKWMIECIIFSYVNFVIHLNMLELT